SPSPFNRRPSNIVRMMRRLFRRRQAVEGLYERAARRRSCGDRYRCRAMATVATTAIRVDGMAKLHVLVACRQAPRCRSPQSCFVHDSRGRLRHLPVAARVTERTVAPAAERLAGIIVIQQELWEITAWEG